MLPALHYEDDPPVCHFTGLAQAPATEFIDGKVSKFSTKAHPKAKGAGFSIKYPASWAAKEGERPNIVQRFVSESGKGLENIIIITTSLPPQLPIGDSDLKALFSPDGLKEMLPDSGKFIRGTSTKIEGFPAGILEFSLREARAGLEIDMHITSILFLQGHTMVQVQCQVGFLSSKASELPSRIAAFRPLFQLVMNSILFDDKWK